MVRQGPGLATTMKTSARIQHVGRRIALYRPSVSEPHPGSQAAPATLNGSDSSAQSVSSSFSSELRQLSRGSTFGVIGQASSALLAFAFSLVVGRTFHADGSGTFFEALAIFTIASNIVDLGADDGLSWAVPRFRAANRSRDVLRLLPIACIPVVIVSTCLSIALFLNAAPIAHLFTHGPLESHLTSFIRILAPFVPVAALVEVLIPGTRGFDRVWPLVLIWLLIIPALRLVLLPLMIDGGMGLKAVAYAWAVPVALGAAALVWAIWNFAVRETELAREGAPVTDRRTLARMFWVFSAPRALASVCSMALIWMDVLLVGYIVSLRMAGIYGVANRYTIAISLVILAVGSTIAPQASRLLSLGRIEDFRRLYQTATGWLMAMAWPIGLLMAVFSIFLMRLFGPSFAAGHTALTILALMMLFVTASGNNMVILVMTGRTRMTLAIASLTVAINLAANLLLIPRLGINGAALAWLVSLVVSNLLTSAVLYHDHRLHPFGPAFLPVVVGSLCLVGLPAVACRAILGNHWDGFVAAVLVSGALYGAYLWVVRDRVALGTLFRHRVAGT